MLFPMFKIEDPGEFVGSAVFLAAILVKGFVEISKQFKLKFFSKKEEMVEPETEKTEMQMEVIPKPDLENLLVVVQNAKQIIESSKNNNVDAMACIGVISILLRIMEKRALETTIGIVESEVYSYLRHNDFPSKLVVTAMFEKSIEEAKLLRKEQKDGLDSRPGN